MNKLIYHSIVVISIIALLSPDYIRRTWKTRRVHIERIQTTYCIYFNS